MRLPLEFASLHRALTLELITDWQLTMYFGAFSGVLVFQFDSYAGISR